MPNATVRDWTCETQVLVINHHESGFFVVWALATGEQVLHKPPGKGSADKKERTKPIKSIAFIIVSFWLEQRYTISEQQSCPSVSKHVQMKLSFFLFSCCLEQFGHFVCSLNQIHAQNLEKVEYYIINSINGSQN